MYNFCGIFLNHKHVGYHPSEILYNFITCTYLVINTGFLHVWYRWLHKTRIGLTSWYSLSALGLIRIGITPLAEILCIFFFSVIMRVYRRKNKTVVTVDSWKLQMVVNVLKQLIFKAEKIPVLWLHVWLNNSYFFLNTCTYYSQIILKFNFVQIDFLYIF